MQPALLLSLAIFGSVAPTSPASEAVLIKGIELAADGPGGAIHTQAERLSGEDVTYRFAEGACKGHAVSDRVLTQLFDAMRSGQRVEIEGTKRGDAQCLSRIRFVAP